MFAPTLAPMVLTKRHIKLCHVFAGGISQIPYAMFGHTLPRRVWFRHLPSDAQVPFYLFPLSPRLGPGIVPLYDAGCTNSADEVLQRGYCMGFLF